MESIERISYLVGIGLISMYLLLAAGLLILRVQKKISIHQLIHEPQMGRGEARPKLESRFLRTLIEYLTNPIR